MIYTNKFDNNPLFHVERFDNEVLLYSVSKAEGIYLNETAYLIWEMCTKDNSTEDIINTLEQAYPEHKQSIKEDIISTIDSLIDKGALITRDDLTYP